MKDCRVCLHLYGTTLYPLFTVDCITLYSIYMQYKHYYGLSRVEMAFSLLRVKVTYTQVWDHALRQNIDE